MGRNAIIAIIIAATSPGLTACKKAPPSYDQRTPEATLRSFEEAVNKRRIPSDLRRFTSNHHEVATWKLRCKTAGGCVKASFQVVSQGVTAADRAILYVDYFVIGDNGSTVIRGQRSPIYFEPAGSRWLITQFGDQIVAKPKATRHDAGPSPSADGSP